MALYSALQKFITKDGAPVEGANVLVRLSGSTTAATLYATRTGTSKSNPFTTLANGEALCYVVPGRYDIIVTKAPDQVTFADIEVGPVSFAGAFAAGGVLTDPDQLFVDADGNRWQWNGALNKTVAPGEDPTAVVGWSLVVDSGLRAELAAEDSAVPIAGVAASTIVANIQDLEAYNDNQQTLNLIVNNTTTLQARIASAASTGKIVNLPPSAITIAAGFTIPANVKLHGVPGKTVLNVSGGSGDVLTFLGEGCEIFGVRIVGGSQKAINFNGYGGHKIRRCVFEAQASHAVLCDSANNDIRWNEFIEAGDSGLALSGVNCKDNEIVRNRFTDCTNFGMWVNSGANNLNIERNRTESNGLELIGITRQCYDITVTRNHAAGTGDNGISITGYRCTAVANVCELNDNHGMGIYGERNTAIGNICRNNGQRNLTTPGGAFAGITCTPAFGGLGRKNILRNNICDDDQSVPTQHYGVKLEVNAHVLWATGQTIGEANRLRYFGLNIYFAQNLGVTGATAPTHTSGTASDGTITWLWVCSNIRSASQNYASWTTAQAVASGTYRVSGNNVYVSTTTGTTGASAPTHTTGSVSDGGVTWLFQEQFPNNFDAYDNFVSGNSASGNLVSAFRTFSANKNNIDTPSLRRMSPVGRNIFSDIIVVASNPEGSVTADPGSIAMRRDASTTPGVAALFKQTGSGNTGWLPAMMRDFGTVAARPDLSALGNGVRGYTYYNIDTGIFEVWNGTAFTDALGRLKASVTGVDPDVIADGAAYTIDVAVSGASLGMYAKASFSRDMLGIDLSAYVLSTNTVRCVFRNDTGASVTLSGATLRVCVEKID